MITSLAMVTSTIVTTATGGLSEAGELPTFLETGRITLDFDDATLDCNDAVLVYLTYSVLALTVFWRSPCCIGTRQSLQT